MRRLNHHYKIANAPSAGWQFFFGVSHSLCIHWGCFILHGPDIFLDRGRGRRGVEGGGGGQPWGPTKAGEGRGGGRVQDCTLTSAGGVRRRGTTCTHVLQRRRGVPHRGQCTGLTQEGGGSPRPPAFPHPQLPPGKTHLRPRTPRPPAPRPPGGGPPTTSIPHHPAPTPAAPMREGGPPPPQRSRSRECTLFSVQGL